MTVKWKKRAGENAEGLQRYRGMGKGRTRTGT